MTNEQIPTPAEGDPAVESWIVKKNRMQLVYPIPLDIREQTGGNYFFTGPGSTDSGEIPSRWPERSTGKRVLAVYNPVDYRVFISANEDKTGQYTDLPDRFNGRDRLNRLLRSLGDAGRNAEVILSEVIDNYMENVSDYSDRWFVLTQHDEDGKMILGLDYLCFDPISQKTFKGFKKALGQPRTKWGRNARYRRLSQGKQGGEGSGESGRGKALMGALAIGSGIEWVSDTPRTKAAQWIGHVLRNQRGAHLWFMIDGSDPGVNPMSAEAILASFGDGFDESLDTDQL